MRRGERKAREVGRRNGEKRKGQRSSEMLEITVDQHALG